MREHRVTRCREAVLACFLGLGAMVWSGCAQPPTPLPTVSPRLASGSTAVAASVASVPAALASEIEVDIGQSLAIKMVLVPGGETRMGSLRGRPDEQPLHQVAISQPFYMGITEVTGDQFTAVVGKPHSSKYQGFGRPVDSISWYDAVAFCNALSVQQKLEPCYVIDAASVTCNVQAAGFRLPTEAEWEYACKAGATTTYPWGDVFDEAHAWSMTKVVSPFDTVADDNVATLASVAQQPPLTASSPENPGSETHPDSYAPLFTAPESSPVAGKLPNKLGLHDMIGNMMEWCNDWYGPYSAKDAVDPTGPKEGEYKVLRGGGWMTSPEYSKPSSRDWVRPDAVFEGYGFRIVCRALPR